jgi:hypothetical protein
MGVPLRTLGHRWVDMLVEVPLSKEFCRAKKQLEGAHAQGTVRILTIRPSHIGHGTGTMLRPHDQLIHGFASGPSC